MGPHRVSPDAALIFEQRRATIDSSSGVSEWEAWQLYESGRFVYLRAGSAPNRARVSRAQLRSVHAWLAQHDFELIRSHAGVSSQPPAGTSASCQLHLSTGLVLAPWGDARYYACGALRELCETDPD